MLFRWRPLHSNSSIKGGCENGGGLSLWVLLCVPALAFPGLSALDLHTHAPPRSRIMFAQVSFICVAWQWGVHPCSRASPSMPPNLVCSKNCLSNVPRPGLHPGWWCRLTGGQPRPVTLLGEEPGWTDRRLRTPGPGSCQTWPRVSCVILTSSFCQASFHFFICTIGVTSQGCRKGRPGRSRISWILILNQGLKSRCTPQEMCQSLTGSVF